MKNYKIILGLSASLSAMFAPAAYASSVDDPLLIRVRGIAAIADESADIEAVEGDVDVGSSIVPELDISYFFTENIAAELILATTNHDVEAVDTALGDVDLGDVWLLPPTVTLQYHFSPRGSVRPYVGAGVNYTFFYEQDPGAVGADVDLDPLVIGVGIGRRF